MPTHQTPAGHAPDNLSPASRKAQLLLASTISFGRHGVKGSSLRDIASDAGVSLSLLSHHFGSKSMLLAAVVAAHQIVCRAGLSQLRTLLQAKPGTLRLSEFIDAWLDYEFALYDTPASVHYLRLLVRLHDDPEVPNEMRLGLHCAEPLALEGLRSICPDVSSDEIDAAWLLASSCTYASILNSQQLAEDLEAQPNRNVKRNTKRFVLAGLSSFLASAAPTSSLAYL